MYSTNYSSVRDIRKKKIIQIVMIIIKTCYTLIKNVMICAKTILS